MGFRIAFLGSSTFAAPALEALIHAGHTIVAVYTQPPRPKGRGYSVQKTPIHLLAETHHLPVFTPTRLKDPEEAKRFRQLDLDYAVVAAYGLLVPRDFLSAPRWGCINIHASLLPRWRGAAPIAMAILEGDHETGVTIMLMDKGLDTGPILTQRGMFLTYEETTSSLQESLAVLGAHLLCPVLEDFASGECEPIPQPLEGITLAPKFASDAGCLDWRQSSIFLERCIRALNPSPGTWFSYEHKRIKVLKAEIVSHATGNPGMVLDETLTIACGEGALRPLVLQRPGGKPLYVQDFLRGYPLPQGTNLNP